jgi:putative endonuclease
LTPAEHRRRLGAFGEGIAATFLRARGGVVVARNVAVGRGEIDLLVRFGGTVAAVEVKTIIPSVPSDDPLDHFTPAKARQVRHLATALEPAVYRVDVVGVTVRGCGVDVRWLPHAC